MFGGWRVRAIAAVLVLLALSACTSDSTTSVVPTTTPSVRPSVEAAEPLTVPDVIGLSTTRAAAMLRKDDLRLAVRPKYGARPYGSVVAVRPNEGSATHPHATITLWVGKKPPRVPDVVRLSPDAARKVLEGHGYAVVIVGEGTSVLKSNPPAGTRRIPGMKVTITVWTPPPPVQTPPPLTITGPPTPPCIPKITC